MNIAQFTEEFTQNGVPIKVDVELSIPDRNLLSIGITAIVILIAWGVVRSIFKPN